MGEGVKFGAISSTQELLEDQALLSGNFKYIWLGLSRTREIYRSLAPLRGAGLFVACGFR